MRLLVSILSFLPLSVLYWIADYLLFPISYYIVRYRRKLVKANLLYSFPQKSAEELLKIEQQFYHLLADIIVEVIYSYRITEEQMRSRIQFNHLQEAAEIAKVHGGCMFMLGHVGNWEWLAEVCHYLEDYGVECTHIYRKLKNKAADSLMFDLRCKHGGSYCEKNLILRTMVNNRKKTAPQAYGMIADQKPSKLGEQYTTEFLHQSTPFLTGTEVLAKKFNYPTFACYITRPKRGYYEVDIRLITDSPKETKEGQITEAFARLLEQNIEDHPHLWLWSHNRWRRKI